MLRAVKKKVPGIFRELFFWCTFPWFASQTVICIVGFPQPGRVEIARS
jgi:hypothetical protein